MTSKIRQTKLSKIIEIPEIVDEGLLHFAEASVHIPFEIKRFYLISNVVDKAIRGKHAHKKTEQVLFCVAGSITILLDDGTEKETIKLDKPNHGIFLDKLMWHEMTDFGPDTILLVMASDYYDESDYLRNYQDFLQYVEKVK